MRCDDCSLGDGQLRSAISSSTTFEADLGAKVGRESRFSRNRQRNCAVTPTGAGTVPRPVSQMATGAGAVPGNRRAESDGYGSWESSRNRDPSGTVDFRELSETLILHLF